MTRDEFEKIAYQGGNKIARGTQAHRNAYNSPGYARHMKIRPLPTTRLDVSTFLKGALWAFDYFQLEKENDEKRSRETLAACGDRETTREKNVR
jgi:hypothetical protein